MWERGWLESWRAVERWVARIHAGPEPARAIVSRLDLAADFAGLSPELLGRTDWVSRSRSWACYGDGLAFTGFRFGADAIVARIYDKTTEIEVSGKEWFRDIWRENGWNGASPIWRIEFQLRRECLKELRLFDRETGELSPERPEALLSALDAVWRYVAGPRGARDEGWLQWKIPDAGEPQRCRWKVRPEWETVRAVAWGSDRYGFVREARKRYDYQALVPGVGGYMTSMAALLGVRDFDAAWTRIGADVRGYLETSDEKRKFLDRVEAKELEIELAREERVGWDTG